MPPALAAKPRRVDPLDRPRSTPTAMPVRVRTAGRIRRQPFHSTRGTYHDDVMLTVVTSGRGWFLRGGQREAVTAGSVGLVLPVAADQDPGLLMADPDDPYDHYYCRFGGALACATASRVAALHGLPTGGFFLWPRLGDVAFALEQMVAHADADALVQPGPAPERPTLTAAESMLLYLLARLEESPTVATQSFGAAELRRYLSDHLAEPIDLNVMSRDFGVSKSHLCRRAKRALGQTIVSCAEQMKMDWARVLLAEPSLSVKQVARRVGYVDPLYFSRVFKRHTGKSPRHWRRELR